MYERAQLCALNVCCTTSWYELAQLCALNICLNMNFHVYYSKIIDVVTI